MGFMDGVSDSDLKRMRRGGLAEWQWNNLFDKYGRRPQALAVVMRYYNMGRQDAAIVRMLNEGLGGSPVKPIPPWDEFDRI